MFGVQFRVIPGPDGGQSPDPHLQAPGHVAVNDPGFSNSSSATGTTSTTSY